MAYDNKKPYKPESGKGVKKYPADKNFTPTGDRPYKEGKSFEKKPYEKKNYGDKPYEKRFYGERPRFEDRPRDEYKAQDKKQYDRDSRRDYDDEDGNTPDPEAEGLVIGRNAVRELLRSDRTVDKLLVRRGDREGSIVVLVAEAVEKGIPIVEVDKAKLDSLAGFVPHQGVIAMVAQKAYCSVEDILAIAAERGEKPFIVIADGITDPYNLGALIRCAEGCGAHGLIIPRRRAVGLTALVAKSSAGAMEHLAVAKVANIHTTILELKKAGVWVYAAEAGGSAHYDTDFRGPCALVMGSEGDGVSRVVKDTCDGIVSIPMYGHVNSFNVSTAASVILAEIARQHHME
ncbi:MAG: 23S rRNA (guanosine(2251)-2'-O)-methyltransferase RlmB [Ruminococcaceae bacterium]|nr:23S rRNA (guanosine(2251)-2'-O)-methyltransferase RlmB [Oscillospiraceae bacterium]